MTVYENAPAYDSLQRIDYYERGDRWTIRESGISDAGGYRLSEIRYKTNINGFLSAMQLVYNVTGLESPLFEASSNIENNDTFSVPLSNETDLSYVSMKVSYGSFYSGIKFEDADRAVVNYKIWFGFGEWSRSQEIP